MAIRAGIESHSQALFFALLVGLLGQGGYAARPGDGEDSEKPEPAANVAPAADIGGSSFLQEADIYKGFGLGDDIYDSMQEKSAHLEEALARTRDQVRRVKTAVKHDELVINDLKEKISEAETLVKATNAEEAELRRGRAHAQLEMFATMARASASSKDILNGKEDKSGGGDDVMESVVVTDNNNQADDAAQLGRQAANEYQQQVENGVNVNQVQANLGNIGPNILQDVDDNQAALQENGEKVLQDVTSVVTDGDNQGSQANLVVDDGNSDDSDSNKAALQENLGADIGQDIVQGGSSDEDGNSDGNNKAVQTDDDGESLVEHEQQQKKEQGADDKSTPEDAMAPQAGGESAIQESVSSEGTQHESKAEQKDASHGKSEEAHKGKAKKHRKGKHGSKKHHRQQHSEALETEGAQ